MTGPSAALAAAWLESGGATVTAFVQRVQQERAALYELLAELGAQPVASQANFVFARFADALAVRDGLAAHGIGVRAFPDRPGLTDALRITCPGECAPFERLRMALRQVCPALRGATVAAGQLHETTAVAPEIDAAGGCA